MSTLMRKQGSRRALSALLILVLVISFTPVMGGEIHADVELHNIKLKAKSEGDLIIINKWNNDIIVSSGGVEKTVTSGNTVTVESLEVDDTITVTEYASGAFRGWRDLDSPFVKGINCAIIEMPAMSAFTTDEAGTTAGHNFFSGFNYHGSLTSLPAGSFDISDITSVGDNFFRSFNRDGSLTSLPAGSFDTSNISTAGSFFFSIFNAEGSLTSLPAGSFDISGITIARSYFFNYFNANGLLTSLPAGSFDISGITTVGNEFFWFFNYRGSLTSLPVGSFDTSNINIAAIDFFSHFNDRGSLTSLPVGSFDTSNISTADNGFFSFFNAGGSLTSLPAGSFNTSNTTSVVDDFFRCFNKNGSLASLPQSFSLPENLTYKGINYCAQMFADSELFRGNGLVSLYFTIDASGVFSGTAITPESPKAGDTVQVNRDIPFSDICVTGITDKTYTGKPVPQTIIVSKDGNTLQVGTDYDIEYTDNINVGTATMIITGKRGYLGSKTEIFRINKADIDDAIISDITDKSYTGKAVTQQEFTAIFGDNTLQMGTDYGVDYSNNTNAGTATMTITGKGNFEGTKAVHFLINKSHIVFSTISDITDKAYTGKAVTQQAFTVRDDDITLQMGTDYDIDYSNNINAGTATMIIIGKGNYYGYNAVHFLIKKADITDASATAPDQTYSGKKLTPTPTVKLRGKALLKGSEYDISYNNNTQIGTATATVTGKGNFTGNKTIKFKINPKKISIKKPEGGKKRITVKWRKDSQGPNYEVQYRLKGKKTWNTKTVMKSKTSLTIKKLKSNKKYQVRVRACKTVNGTKYTGAWSSIKTVKTKN